MPPYPVLTPTAQFEYRNRISKIRRDVRDTGRRTNIIIIFEFIDAIVFFFSNPHVSLGRPTNTTKHDRVYAVVIRTVSALQRFATFTRRRRTIISLIYYESARVDGGSV